MCLHGFLIFRCFEHSHSRSQSPMQNPTNDDFVVINVRDMTTFVPNTVWEDEEWSDTESGPKSTPLILRHNAIVPVSNNVSESDSNIVLSSSSIPIETSASQTPPQPPTMSEKDTVSSTTSSTNYSSSCLITCCPLHCLQKCLPCLATSPAFFKYFNPTPPQRSK